MKMRPTLIIDIRDRSIFSLLVDGSGNIQPCTHNVMEYSLRYFFGEIFLDLKTYDQLTGEKSSDLFDAFESNDYDIIRIGWRMGWRWLYQLASDEAAVPVKNPLKVLSSVLPTESKKFMKWVLRTSYALLEFLLEPVFRYVRAMNFGLTEINVIFIIPNYFHRRAQLLLQKMMRKMKVHKIKIVAREVATLMAGLEVSSMDKAIVLDMGSVDTQLYRFEVDRSANEIRFSSLDCSTLRNSGWHSVVAQFCEGLYKEKLLDKKVALHRSAVNKSLLGLVFGINPSPIASSPPLKITHGLFNQIFVQSKRKLPKKYFSDLKNWILNIGSKDDIIIPLGFSFMVGNLEERLFSAIKSPQVSPVLSHRSLERSAYGMAAGLNWLRREPGRKIKTVNKAGFRVSTGPNESIELVSHTSLPANPGEQHTIRQVLDFKLEEEVSKDILHFHLLWGMDPNPKYNLNVCLLPLNVAKNDLLENRKIECTIEIQRARFGNNLKGTVTLRFGTQQETAAFNIENDIKDICSEDIM